jgi:hypothetical protein
MLFHIPGLRTSVLLIAILSLSSSLAIGADDYPSRPIKLMVEPRPAAPPTPWRGRSRFEALHDLADRRQVGKGWLLLRTGHAVGAQLACAHLRRSGHEADEHHVDLAAPKSRRHATVARKESADCYSANVLPVIREIQRSGIKSLRGIARALAARGIPTARGGAWTPVQVSAILQRAS